MKELGFRFLLGFLVVSGTGQGLPLFAEERGNPDENGVTVREEPRRSFDLEKNGIGELEIENGREKGTEDLKSQAPSESGESIKTGPPDNSPDVQNSQRQPVRKLIGR